MEHKGKMEHKKEWGLGLLNIASQIITVAVWLNSTSQFWKGVTAASVVILGTLWLHQFYSDIRSEFRKKEENFDRIVADISQSMTIIRNSIEVFGDTCCQTRGEVVEYHHDIVAKLETPSRIEYDVEIVKRQLRTIIDNLREPVVLKIICYGRKGYGYITDYIADSCPQMKVEVIVCKPGIYELSKKDTDKINQQIISMLSNNFSVYVSSIPPSIRASAIYDSKHEPLWCSVQSYKLGKDPEDQLTIICPNHYPICVESADSKPENIAELISVFENEYNELLNNSEQAVMTSKGEINYIEIV